MLSRTFMVDAGVRVARTFAQALIGALGLDGAGVISGTWHQALAVALSAAVLSALTQLASVSGSDMAETPNAAPMARSEAPGPIIKTGG